MQFVSRFSACIVIYGMSTADIKYQWEDKADSLTQNVTATIGDRSELYCVIVITGTAWTGSGDFCSLVSVAGVGLINTRIQRTNE